MKIMHVQYEGQSKHMKNFTIAISLSVILLLNLVNNKPIVSKNLKSKNRHIPL